MRPLNHTANHTSTGSSNVPVRLPDIPIDSRRAFIEHVCAIMIENRFPAERRFRHIFQFSDAPELFNGVFLVDRGCGYEPEYTCDTLGHELEMRIVTDSFRVLLDRYKAYFTPEEIEYGLACLDGRDEHLAPPLLVTQYLHR